MTACVTLLSLAKVFFLNSSFSANQHEDLRRRVSMLILIVAWLSDCVAAVKLLLSHQASLSTLTALVHVMVPPNGRW